MIFNPSLINRGNFNCWTNYLILKNQKKRTVNFDAASYGLIPGLVTAALNWPSRVAIQNTK
jgi:hypothetical protein